MIFFLNDLSLHRQFYDSTSFHTSLLRLMAMESKIQRYGRDLYCTRGFASAEPIRGVPLQQAIAPFSKDFQNVVMVKLQHQGPFWDDIREHGVGDYFECKGDVVTDTAVGEAAFRSLHGVDCGLISLSPSDWQFSPVETIWRQPTKDMEDAVALLRNWWEAERLDHYLEEVAPRITSWDQLQGVVAHGFDNLVFADDWLLPMEGHSFAEASSKRFIVLLRILDRIAGAVDASGKRTEEGRELYRKHFTGDTALFSDSSDTEKNRYRKRMTFRNPEKAGEVLFCPWHGKVRRLTLRLHFSWPSVAGRPLYIVYAGPKISKR